MTAPDPEVPRGELDLALIAEACRKSGLIWLGYPGLPQPRPAWHVWHDGAAYVLTGPEEQPLPGLAELAELAGPAGSTTGGASTGGASTGGAIVTVNCRAKDTRALLVTWSAHAAVVPAHTPSWDVVVPALRTARLNTDPNTQVERWAHLCALVRLTPTGEVLERHGEVSADAHLTEPVGSPATTREKLPWVAHKRASQSPRLS